MKRSQQILVVCHCLLNANAKVSPLAVYPGALMETLLPFLQQGVGLVQLPCPESAYLGINRWGMSREQYDHPRFRRHCRQILMPIMDQLETFCAAGCAIAGVVGADGSPNCGVNQVPLGLKGGVIGAGESADAQAERLEMAPGTGVFMTVFKQLMAERQIAATFMAVDENHPGQLMSEERKGDSGK